jgi:hypothetical protein
MPPETPEPPDSTIRRGCQFSLLGIFVFITVVAVIVAIATGAFGDLVSRLAVALVAITISVTIGLVAVACVFWPPVLLIIWVQSLITRQWYRGQRHDSPADSSATDSNLT